MFKTTVLFISFLVFTLYFSDNKFGISITKVKAMDPKIDGSEGIEGGVHENCGGISFTLRSVTPVN